MMKILRSLGIIGVVGLCFLVQPVRADIFDTYENGPRGMAMGGALCAEVDDTASLYYNPAGLSKLTGHTLGFGYMYNGASIDVSGPIIGAPTNSDLTLGTYVLDVALDLNKMVRLPRQCTFALGLTLRDDMTFLSLEDTEEYRYAFVQFNSSIKRTTIYLGLGIDAIPELLRLGFGAHSIVVGDATTNLTLGAEDLSTTQHVIPAKADVWMEMELANSPIVGLQLTPFKNLSLGLCYRDGIKVEMDPFFANLDITIGSSAASVAAYTAILSFWNPESYQAGLSYRFGDLLVEADLTLDNWSEFKRSTPRELRRVSPSFNDVISYHLGLEYPVKGFDLRAGYQYAPTPVPDQLGNSNYLGTDRHIVSLGCGTEFKDPLNLLLHPVRVGLALQEQFLKKRTYTKIDSLPYSLSGSVFSATLALQFKL